MNSEEYYYTKDITKQKISELTRKVLSIDIPTGIGYGNFIRYEMRRHMIDDSGILLKYLKDSDEYEIVDRYIRCNEWKIIKFLSLETFKNLGVLKPDLMWPEDKDKYFQERIRNIDMDVLVHLKDTIDEESDLGSLFG